MSKPNSYIPGFVERSWLTLRERLHIDIYCERCGDPCHGAAQRKARLCELDLDERQHTLALWLEELEAEDDERWCEVVSPFDTETVRPGDPAWELLNEATKGDVVVSGTYDPTTGEVQSSQTQPRTQGATPFPYACCWACTPDYQFMLVCQKCGNKRCPHASDHRNECIGSNEWWDQ